MKRCGKFRTKALAVAIFLTCCVTARRADTSDGQPINGTIEILQIALNGSSLHVSDMYEIENGSNSSAANSRHPTFEVYLPPQAKLESVFASSPGQAVVTIGATAVTGEPGHFTVNFPLRPGATRFAFNYILNYAGRFLFRNKREYSVQQMAVMLPAGMNFAASEGAFQLLATGDPSHLVEASGVLAAGSGPDFEISGKGQRAELAEANGPASQTHGAATKAYATPGTAPLTLQAVGSFRKVSDRSPLVIWILVLLCAAVLATGAIVISAFRKGRSKPRDRERMAREVRNVPRYSGMLQTIAAEMSRLERDALVGRISTNEYQSTRTALEQVRQRLAGSAS